MKQIGPIRLIAVVCATLASNTPAGWAIERGSTSIFAADDQSQVKADSNKQQENNKEKPGSEGEKAEKMPELTPEQKMLARFPQPAKVGHLIGLPVLDGNDSTIGYVEQVVRTADGKIQLIVPYGRWFGWARDRSFFAWGRRQVAVPIEVVAILARQINAVDMDRAEFDKAATWVAGQSQPIPPDQTVKIGLGRR